MLEALEVNSDGDGDHVCFLVAEDDELVGRVLVRALAPHGRTELVRTLQDARSALAGRSFTAVVVDVGLPDGCGLDLIANARERDPTVSALIVSGRVDERKLAAAHDMNASYLLKPVDTRQLGLFAVRMRSKVRRRQTRIASLIQQWADEYDLTDAQASVLELAVIGTPRVRLAQLRSVKPSTVKKQVQVILTKTGDASLEGAVSRLLRASLDEP